MTNVTFACTQDHVQAVQEMESLAGSAWHFYHLTHTFGYEGEDAFFVSKLPPFVVEVVLAHIQYVCDTLGKSHLLSIVDTALILTKLYGGNLMLNHRYATGSIYSYDLLHNWEKFCGRMGQFDTPSILKTAETKEAILKVACE